jgi:hypothetical protein
VCWTAAATSRDLIRDIFACTELVRHGCPGLSHRYCHGDCLLGRCLSYLTVMATYLFGPVHIEENVTNPGGL